MTITGYEFLQNHKNGIKTETLNNKKGTNKVAANGCICTNKWSDIFSLYIIRAIIGLSFACRG